ncbi:MAG: serine/threonine-protein kinase [Myxococcales bacterium]|nr:serine/threonine protein kinase [Myxococcales bacterium]HIK85207.1 serine/threonine protein kinase [Myxococcales bacterium]
MSTSTLVGRRLGGFTVERELGRGGMGIVVLARQQSLDRPAVLKRIHAELAIHPELEARFEREAVAAAKLHHPNVVSVYDRFQHRGAQYLATEFVDGVDLSKVLEHEGRLPWRIAATIALEIARGLEAIHNEGTLHRDLKPQNLLIGRRGEVKIADFGLALDSSGTALTQPGIAVGTPPYMSPEQLRGERVDPRTDLFAFGCVLYEMLKGQTPYSMPNIPDAESEERKPGKSLLAKIESGRYARVRTSQREIPRSLARLVRRCLVPRLTRRISTAAEVRRQLEAILDRPPREECQSLLAAFLWERQIFEARETETVVMVACPNRTTSRRALRLTWAAAALAFSMLSLSFSLQYPEQVTGWTLALTSEFAPIAAQFSSKLNR